MKRSWIYCHVDAPEDNRGTLKRHYEELVRYSDQMGFLASGYSDDLGGRSTLHKDGLQAFLDAARAGEVDVLIVKDVTRISKEPKWQKMFLDQMKRWNIEVYSPDEGKLDFVHSASSSEKSLLSIECI